MMKVSAEEARQRFAILPASLQDASLDVETNRVIDDVCEEFHIPEEKSSKVAWVVGIVLFGFLRPEDTAKELEETAGIDPLNAKAAAKKLEEGIFSRLKADLDLVYAPPGGPSPAPAPEPVKASPFPPSPAAPAPKPIFNLEATPFTRAEPPVAAPSVPVTAPSAPQPLQVAPVFLHKEETIRPIEPPKSSGPRFNFSSLKFQDAKPMEKPAAARLEIGQAPAAPRSSGPARAEATPTKVVHYSEWSSAPKPAAPEKKDEPAAPVPLSNLNMPRPAAPAPVAAPSAQKPSEDEKKAAFLAHITSTPASAPAKPAAAAPPVATSPSAFTPAPAPSRPPVAAPTVPTASAAPAPSPVSTPPAAPAPAAKPAAPPQPASSASEVIDLTSF